MITADRISHHYSIWKNEEEFHKTALEDVSLDIHKGQFIVILGQNGSGKSTLAKHLNAILLPDAGTVWIDGSDTRDMTRLKAIRDTVGMVFQNPDNQIVGMSVEEDVAFGPENRCMEPDKIRTRVNESLEQVGLADKTRVSPHRLSGGQKQRVAIAGTLAADTECIVLDEPTAMLDPRSRREVIELITDLNKAGRTIILITHHADEAILADVVILMEKAHIVFSGTPREVFARRDLIDRLGLELPAAAEIACMLSDAGIGIELPVLTDDELCRQVGILAGVPDRERLNEDTSSLIVNGKQAVRPERAVIYTEEGRTDPILRVDNITFTYGRGTANECKVIDGLSLEVRENEFLGLIGSSGAGKTTLIKHLNGLLNADSGTVYYNGSNIYDKKYKLSSLRKEVGLVFQNPEQQLFCRTVMKDVCYGPLNMGMSAEEAETSAAQSLELVGISEDMYDSNPVELSGGQMRRVAIAGILAMQPKVIVMDEPAAGLDPGARRSLFDLLARIREERGITVVLVSHDMEDIAEHTDRVLVLHEGTIYRSGTPEEVFSDPEGLAAIGIGVPPAVEILDKLRSQGLNIKGQAVTRTGAALSIAQAVFRGERGDD